MSRHSIFSGAGNRKKDTYNGINLEAVKNSNRSSILRLLNDRGPLSRKDLSDALGLTPASVTTICTPMLEEGLLVETGEVSEAGRAGRRKILLDVNDTYRYVLTFSLEASVSTVSVCNLKGEACHSVEVPTDASVPEAFLRALADKGKAILWENNIPRSSLLGAGVSVPGPVDRLSGTSLRAYRMWDQPVPVKEILETELNCPIVLENNVKAFAAAELLYGIGKTEENLLFVKWGPGVGSSIVTHGRIYESSAFKNAEIGHVIVEPGGLPCRCGRRGCLETRVSALSLSRKISESSDPEATPRLWEFSGKDPSRIGPDDLPEIAALNESSVFSALDKEIALLSRVVCHMATMLAPDKVILTGSLFRIPQFMEMFQTHCREYDPIFNESYLVLSDLDAQSALLSPLAVAVDELFFGE